MLGQVESITYRGSLKSCNYTCSYCPFGKRAMDHLEIEQDKEYLRKFSNALYNYAEKGDVFHKPVNLLFAPYGEAMIHLHYREALAELSQKDYIRRVGCQTNLSFQAEDWMAYLMAVNADFKKIVLWATFHPEMTSVTEFSGRVKLLSSIINLSVGVVGNPRSASVIKQLREMLPPQIYLWINQMDGMKRRYTSEEILFFKSIDPMFEWELRRGKKQACEGGTIHWFVNAKGDLFPCNRSMDKIGDFYDLSSGIRQMVCSGKRCDCYLAYSHTDEFKKCLFLAEERLHRVPQPCVT